MFDRHQAEITVMQFRGHSLPVYQSMSVPWDFLPCPISSDKHAYAISSHNCHWNVALPFGASPRNGKFGRVEGHIQQSGLFFFFFAKLAKLWFDRVSSYGCCTLKYLSIKGGTFTNMELVLLILFFKILCWLTAYIYMCVCVCMSVFVCVCVCVCVCVVLELCIY